MIIYPLFIWDTCDLFENDGQAILNCWLNME